MRERDPELDYDARQRTTFTLPEVEEMVGYKAVLPMTGRIVEARESEAGPYAIFVPDERWGMPGMRLGLDLEAFRGLEE